jgi:hypothetical protein
LTPHFGQNDGADNAHGDADFGHRAQHKGRGCGCSACKGGE